MRCLWLLYKNTSKKGIKKFAGKKKGCTFATALRASEDLSNDKRGSKRNQGVNGSTPLFSTMSGVPGLNLMVLASFVIRYRSPVYRSLTWK